MPKQTRPEDDNTIPNRSANMEKAEGSRENLNSTDDSGGITNRPLSREKGEQQELPPRGQAAESPAGQRERSAGKEDGHA